MADYTMQAVLLADTGNTEDVNVNNFAITDTGLLDATEAGQWRDAIKTFYDDCVTLGALKGRAQTGHYVKIYDALGTAPNYPLFELSFALTANPTGIEMPAEVALAVGYANTVANSVPRARRRGRIYVSEWSEASNDGGRPTSSTFVGLVDAYLDYVTTVNAITGIECGVWSRSNSVCYPVDLLYCDNEWDTMRSRGGKATIRQPRLVP